MSACICLYVNLFLYICKNCTCVLVYVHHPLCGSGVLCSAVVLYLLKRIKLKKLKKTGGLSEGAARITEHQFGGWMVKLV